MPGLNYNGYVTQMALMAVVDPTDVNFLAILPMMIDYASLRIARDLNLVSASVSIFGPTYQLTAGRRDLFFPQDFSYSDPSNGTTTNVSFVVSEQINLISASRSSTFLYKRCCTFTNTSLVFDIIDLQKYVYIYICTVNNTY